MVSSPSGSIVSLDVNNDGNYEANLDCKWIFDAPPNKLYELNFEYVTLPEDNLACEDYVEVGGDYFKLFLHQKWKLFMFIPRLKLAFWKMMKRSWSSAPAEDPSDTCHHSRHFCWSLWAMERRRRGGSK